MKHSTTPTTHTLFAFTSSNFLTLALSFLLFTAGAPRAVRADTPITPGFAYGSTKVRGANIGGWLVLEPWITPGVFSATGNDAVVDEWTFCQMQERSVAQAALQTHWETFYTESDFKAIAAAGLNHVRIPIGYWAFEVGPGEPFIQGQLQYLQKAIGWAGTYGLKVIVDLHGAPGSQNGYDNSGQRMSVPTWETNSTDIARTNAIMKTIAGLYVSNPNVVATIEPLNEPAGYFGSNYLDAIKQYWLDSYGSIRFPYGTSQESNTVVLIHDAFQAASTWDGFMVPPDHQGVVMDTHIYQVFSDGQVAMSQAQHIQTACAQISALKEYQLWVVVGEWAPAITDCALSLNGRGVGARYDGSYSGSQRVGSCTGMSGAASGFSSDYKSFLRQYWEAQTLAYEEGGAGWIQWAWKTEDGAGEEWSYEKGLQYGWIPQDPTQRMYPNICSS